MPTNGRKKTYGFLDQLSTEQLLDLVRADVEPSEDGDDDLMLRILEVIEEREKANPTGLLPDAAQAWEDFQRYFNTPDGTDRPLYPMRDSRLEAVTETADKPFRRGRLFKRLLPLAAVVAVAFSGMVAAQALGMDVFGALARWTDETFHFISAAAPDPGSPDSETLRQTVQEAFDLCGVPVPAPAWYPEGTALAGDIDVVEDLQYSIVTCNFTCGSNFWRIMVQQYYDDELVPVYTFEKDASKVKEYPSNSRLFYIVSNYSEDYATYSSGQTVFVISGKLSSAILRQIIDSIGA